MIDINILKKFLLSKDPYFPRFFKGSRRIFSQNLYIDKQFKDFSDYRRALKEFTIKQMDNNCINH